MHNHLSIKILNTLVCSYCKYELSFGSEEGNCCRCGLTYKYNDSGSLDLRLKKPKKITMEFEVGNKFFIDNGLKIQPLSMNPDPEVDFSNENVPYHLNKEILSYFPKAKSADSLALDLGCGNGIHKSVCECAGFNWVGLDYSTIKAPILGDGHALPFRSDSFEFILSIAVLEHVRYPFVMMREAFRVLKPNGIFIGTVAFLEPFHGGSFYHHTHLGTVNCLQYGGFKIIKVSPSINWTALRAQANMGLFPKMPLWMSSLIIYPIEKLSKIWWCFGKLRGKKISEQSRIINTTGAFTFIAMKN